MKISDEAVLAAQAEYRRQAEKYNWYSWPSEESMRSIVTAALPYLQAGYEVKKLEWEQDKYGAIEFSAQSMFGEYSVFIKRKSAYACSLDGVTYERINLDYLYTLDEAKAAAQADFECRVRECIEDAQLGWLYFNEDTGIEYSRNHPVTSGECPDALDVLPATAKNLLNQLLTSWDEREKEFQEIEVLRAAVSMPVDVVKVLNSAALIVEGRSTAANGELVKSLISKNENEIAEILAKHDKALAAEIRSLSVAPTEGQQWSSNMDLAPSDTVILMAWFNSLQGGWEYEAGVYHSSRGGWWHGSATHWMPLPATPTEEGEK